MMIRTILAAALAATIMAAPPANATDAPATVRLHVVDTGGGAPMRRFVGRVEALRTVDLSFQLAGEMIEMPVLNGDVLEKGALIAALDTSDFELAVRRAKARRDLAQLEFDRARDLAARGAATQSRRDEAVAERLLAEVEYEAAQRDLTRTRLVAPFEALVARRLVDAFSYVTPGYAVVRVQDVSEMRVVISVPEDLVALSRDPDKFRAYARLAALPGVAVPLTLSEYVTEADPIAQTYEVSFALTGRRNPAVLPGMTATVEIRANGGGEGGAPSIPMTAVDPNGPDGFQVWVFDADTQTVAPRPVQLGLGDGATVPVLDGLADGEVIVAAGVGQLSAGMPVRPLDL